MIQVILGTFFLRQRLPSPVDNSPPRPWTVQPNRNWHWSPARLTLMQLPERLTFRAPAPARLSPGYSLTGIEVLWIPKTAFSEAPVRPRNRQLLHLRYTSRDDVLDVIVAKNLRQAPGTFVKWAYNAQCFVTARMRAGDFKEINWVYGFGPNTNTLLVSKNKGGDVVVRLRDELMARIR